MEERNVMYSSVRGNDGIDPPVVARNLRTAANTVNYLTNENDRLESENNVLRQRIDLLKKNSDLKTATVLSSIITWMDEKKGGKGREGVSGRAGSPFRPATPVLNESAFKFLQSQVDSDADQEDGMATRIQPSVRFDTSRNTARAPPEEPLAGGSAFQGYGRPSGSQEYPRPRGTAEYVPQRSDYARPPTIQEYPSQRSSQEFGYQRGAQEYAPQRGSQEYAPSRTIPRSASGSQTTAKNSFTGRTSGMFDEADSSMGRSAYQETSLRDSAMSAPLASSSIKGSSTSDRPNASRGGMSASEAMFLMEDPECSCASESVDEKKLGAKLARFSRPIDEVIGVRAEPRYYQGIMELKPTRRLVGEIAFQLDRRILDYVFASEDSAQSSKTKKKRYYGYTVTHIFDKIRAESKDVNGIPNSKREISMRYRLEYLMKRLAPLGYKLETHAPFSQDMVNKYGLLSSPPERKTLDNFGLEDPRVLRMLVSKLMIFDDELKNTLILLDCLCLMAHEDGGPLFKW